MTGERRGPYSKTPEVRRRIIEAATELFSVSGFHGATVKDIAERAGLTAKGVGHHFASKDELFMAVLGQRELAAGQLMAEPFDNRRLVQVLLGVFEGNLRTPYLVQLHAVISAEAAHAGHPGHAHYKVRYDSLRDGLAASLEKLRAEGLVISPLDSTILASSIIAMMDGLQVQWLYSPEMVDAGEALRMYLSGIIDAEWISRPEVGDAELNVTTARGGADC